MIEEVEGNLTQHAAPSTSKESTVPKPAITYNSTLFLPFEPIKREDRKVGGSHVIKKTVFRI